MWRSLAGRRPGQVGRAPGTTPAERYAEQVSSVGRYVDNLAGLRGFDDGIGDAQVLQAVASADQMILYPNVPTRGLAQEIVSAFLREGVR